MAKKLEDWMIALIIIVSILAVVAIIAVCCCIRIWSRRRRQLASEAPKIISRPGSGEYDGPLTVELQNLGSDWQVLVRVVNKTRAGASPLAPYPSPTTTAGGGAKGAPPQVVIGQGDTTLQSDGFMLYHDPLHFDTAGTYEVCAYSVDEAQKHRSPFATFTFVVGSARVTDRGMLAAPTISPGGGEVTDRTQITLTHPSTDPTSTSSSAHNGCIIRYSLDGKNPSLTYTHPFTLKLNQPNVAQDFVIKAQAQCGHMSSAMTEAKLHVVSGRSIIYDPTIAAPVADVEVSNPTLYFTHPRKDVAIFYAVVSLDRLRSEEQHEAQSELPTKHTNASPPRDLSPRRLRVVQYDNHVVPLTEEVGQVIAWAVDLNHPDEEGPRSVYDVRFHTTLPVEVSTKTKRKKSNRLAVPEIYLTCADISLTFSHCPASYSLRYTLDGTEPTYDDGDMRTMTLAAGGTCHPMRVARGSVGNVQLVARWFQPMPNDDVRFGRKLSRVFCRH